MGDNKLHNLCFFSFMISNGKTSESLRFRRTRDKSEILIPIPRHSLPYLNDRRNVKIFKMLGYLIFPWAKRLIWRDAKFRMKKKMDDYLPNNYFKNFEDTIDENNVCAVYVGLPADGVPTGSSTLSTRENGFHRHCNLLSTS